MRHHLAQSVIRAVYTTWSSTAVSRVTELSRPLIVWSSYPYHMLLCSRVICFQGRNLAT